MVYFNASNFQTLSLGTIELEDITKEKHPGFFSKGSQLNAMPSLKGLKSPADPSKIILKGNFETFDHAYMKIAVKNCTELRLPKGD